MLNIEQMGDRLQIEMPCKLTYRDAVGTFIASICRELSYSTESREFEYQLISAFNEAFNNLAEHGYVGEPEEGQVSVVLETTDRNFEIMLCSFGTHFEYSDTEIELEDLPESGMGLYIMRSFMDELVFEKGEGQKPNMLHMKKRFPRKSQGVRPLIREGGDA